MSRRLGLRYLSDLQTGQTSSRDEYSPIRRSPSRVGRWGGGAEREAEGVEERELVIPPSCFFPIMKRDIVRQAEGIRVKRRAAAAANTFQSSDDLEVDSLPTLFELE